MNKLGEFLELNELTEMYDKYRSTLNPDFNEEDVEDNSDLLICCFYWGDTEEGFDFWESVNNDYLTWLYEEQRKLETLR